jgi:hypothetical protein
LTAVIELDNAVAELMHNKEQSKTIDILLVGSQIIFYKRMRVQSAFKFVGK